MNSRMICFDILKKVEDSDIYVGELLDGALRTIQFSDKRDRAFITRLVEGVTERKYSLDFLIDKFSRKSPDPDVRIILRMGIYQIKYMDSVPDRAAISESVELTKELGYKGLSGFVNGLLRNVARAKDENKLDSYLVSRMDTRYSTPKWLCDFLVETYGKGEAKTILEDQFIEHDTVVRVNTLKTDRESLRKLFEEKGIEVKDGVLLLNGKPLKLHGVNSHDLVPETGKTVSLESLRRDVKMWKEGNVNFLRGCHYAQDERKLELCDSAGIYVLDEVSFHFWRQSDTVHADNLVSRAEATVTEEQAEGFRLVARRAINASLELADELEAA